MKSIKILFILLVASGFAVAGPVVNWFDSDLFNNWFSAVALADDDDEDERDGNRNDDEEDDDERRSSPAPAPVTPAPVQNQPKPEPKSEEKVEVITTLVKLPDQVVEELITTTIYDSDGDGVFDPDDATPELHNAYVVEDANSNGLDDAYENR